MARTAEVTRKTKETEIFVSLNIDGTGKSEIKTDIGFFDHMLEALARHSGCDITLKATGDLHVDEHHTVEDAGLVLGEAFKKALGDKRGINRFGWAMCPLDEALARVVIDLSGRAFCHCQLPVNLHRIGEMHGETIPEFFRAIANAGGMNIHVDLIRGENLHHIIEALFKSFARALKQAIAPDQSSNIPSTKGILA